MPQFQIEGDAELFEAAEEIEVGGDICRFGFVTAETVEGHVVLITPVEPKDLPDFEGPLFQVDVNEAEDAVILRQVQMFFWPWDDDDFEDMESPDGEPDVT